MANTTIQITLIAEGGKAGPLYDAFYSTDCVTYLPFSGSAAINLPDIFSTVNLTIPDNTQCIRLVNLTDGCESNYITKNVNFTTTTTSTTTAGPTTTTTTSGGGTTTTTTAGPTTTTTTSGGSGTTTTTTTTTVAPNCTLYTFSNNGDYGDYVNYVPCGSTNETAVYVPDFSAPQYCVQDGYIPYTYNPNITISGVASC